MDTAQHATHHTVSVCDEISHALVGHPGRRYASPPRGAQDARELIATLLGRPVAAIGGQGPCRAVIAGGRRTVELRASDHSRALDLEVSNDD